MRDSVTTNADTDTRRDYGTWTEEMNVQVSVGG